MMIKGGSALPVVYGTGRRAARKARRMAPAEWYLLESLEPRLLMTAGPLVVPTPLLTGVPLLATTADDAVIAGLSLSDDSGAFLVRFDPSGRPDQSFGVDGVVLLNGVGELISFDVRPDGHLLVLAENYGTGAVSLWQFDRDGQADPTFGDGGHLTLPRPVFNDTAMALTPDGRIVVAVPLPPDGVTAFGPADAIGLCRYTSDGRPDPTLGGNGFVQLPLAGQFNFVTGLRADDVGEVRLMVLPWSGPGMYVVHADTSRTDLPVESFHLDPYHFSPGTFWTPDGRIVDLADGPGGLYPLTISRFTADGAPDPTFDGDGRAGYDPGPSSDFASVAPPQFPPDGRMIITGWPYDDIDETGFKLYAINPDGSRDTSFGTDGAAPIPFPGPAWEAWDYAGAAVDGRGRIVTASFYRYNSSGEPYAWKLGIQRYTPDGAPDPMFGVRGNAFLDTRVVNAPASKPAPEPSPDPARPPGAPAPPSTDDESDDVLLARAATPAASPFATAISAVDDVPTLLGVTPTRALLGQRDDDLFAA